MDAAFLALEQYDLRVAGVYFSPSLITDAPKADAGTPYHVTNIAFTSAQNVSYSAPSYGWKANMLYPARNPRGHNYGAANGQAPTSGVYTGIPSGCGPSGAPGGGGMYS